jgi:hypothetical protein
MYDQEVIGLGGTITLGLAVLFVCAYLLLNFRNAAAHLVAFYVVAIPLMGNKYLPGEVFGIRGLSPINFVTAMAFIAIMIKVAMSGRIYGYIMRYLPVPLILLMLVYALGVGQTLFSGGDHMYFEGPSTLTRERGRTDFLLYEVIRPLQIMLVGLLVLVACDNFGSKRVIQRAVLLAPVALSSMALAFSIQGGLENYAEARMMLGIRMGMHGNGFGALSVYLLAGAITMRAHDWPTMRYVAIGFALLGIVLSFSRIAFVTSVVILAFFFFRLPAREKLIVGVISAVMVLLFSGQLIARIQFGLDDGPGGIDWEMVSAGRVNDIWLYGFQQYMQRPIFGYGVGMLVDSPLSGRIVPHNGYLSVLLDLGLIGLLALFNLLFWAIRSAIKSGDELLFQIAAMMMLSLTGHSFYPGTSNYIVWVFYGMMLHSFYAKETEPPAVKDASRLATPAALDR